MMEPRVQPALHMQLDIVRWRCTMHQFLRPPERPYRRHKFFDLGTQGGWTPAPARFVQAHMPQGTERTACAYEVGRQSQDVARIVE
jgi:hypothetical protein